MRDSSDEYYTPRALIEPILPWINKWCELFKIDNHREPIIWCPFDKADSEFVIALNAKHSHINDGGDFFELVHNYEYDIAISNPPFSRKLDVFKALDKRQKPWMMLCSVMALNYNEVLEYFAKSSFGRFQMLMLTKKMSYNGGKVPFNSSYYCRGVLEHDIEFCEVLEDNTGSRFVPSRMSGLTRPGSFPWTN
jgi:hypothetical protein